MNRETTAWWRGSDCCLFNLRPRLLAYPVHYELNKMRDIVASQASNARRTRCIQNLDTRDSALWSIQATGSRNAKSRTNVHVCHHGLDRFGLVAPPYMFSNSRSIWRSIKVRRSPTSSVCRRCSTSARTCFFVTVSKSTSRRTDWMASTMAVSSALTWPR